MTRIHSTSLAQKDCSNTIGNSRLCQGSWILKEWERHLPCQCLIKDTYLWDSHAGPLLYIIRTTHLLLQYGITPVSIQLLRSNGASFTSKTRATVHPLHRNNKRAFQTERPRETCNRLLSLPPGTVSSLPSTRMKTSRSGTFKRPSTSRPMSRSSARIMEAGPIISYSKYRNTLLLLLN